MGKESKKSKANARETPALKLLLSGFRPKRTKFGTSFKGKKVIIIARGSKRRKSE